MSFLLWKAKYINIFIFPTIFYLTQISIDQNFYFFKKIDYNNLFFYYDIIKKIIKNIKSYFTLLAFSFIHFLIYVILLCYHYPLTAPAMYPARKYFCIA